MAELSISSGVARIPYGYEYAGNDRRLVITPLTDRCFRSIFLSLHYSHGIALAGQASTGKTETTKEIAKCAGKMCFVFNCSSALDYGSLINFFKGFVSGGSWTCFDEFNRISFALMAVMSQTIMQVNQALRLQKTEMTFAEGGRAIKVDGQCAIFVTMNTTHHAQAAGTDVPSNLLSQFRAIQMTVPDTTLIVETLLLCGGFRNHRVLTKKLMAVFEFSQNQLTPDPSNDFSLRSIKSILNQAIKYMTEIAGKEVLDTTYQAADEAVQQALLLIEEREQAGRKRRKKRVPTIAR